MNSYQMVLHRPVETARLCRQYGIVSGLPATRQHPAYKPIGADGYSISVDSSFARERRWGSSVSGVADVEGRPSLKQEKIMVQKLLTDRFKLVSHHEMKELS